MARRFQFRLDVVRDMRKRARDEAARSVAVKALERTAVQKRADEISAASVQAGEDARSRRVERTLSLSDLRMQQYYGNWLFDQSHATSLELRRVDGELAREREKLAAAMARMRAIEKLRERRWQVHLLETRREEQAVMDEIAGRTTVGRDPVEETGAT